MVPHLQVLPAQAALAPPSQAPQPPDPAPGNVPQLTVTAVTGLISAGDMIAGTGVPAGTTILSQASGTPGGAGTYNLSATVTTNAATVTSFGNVLNVTAATGVIAVGSPVDRHQPYLQASPSPARPAGRRVAWGVYTLVNPATAYVPSTAITTAGGVGTNFVARSSCAIGELVVISTWG